MKKTIHLLLVAFLFTAIGCKQNSEATSETTTENTEATSTGQEGVVDENSAPNIVQVASGSKDHTTLVAAVKAADLVRSLSNAGPFTVFAPTNAAFTAFNTELAPGGLAGVSIPNLTKVLQYHVTNGNVLAASLFEGQVVSTLETPQTFEIQLTGGPKIKDVRNRISNITATDVQCDNGVIHVLDKVLLPKL